MLPSNPQLLTRNLSIHGMFVKCCKGTLYNFYVLFLDPDQPQGHVPAVDPALNQMQPRSQNPARRRRKVEKVERNVSWTKRR